MARTAKSSRLAWPGKNVSEMQDMWKQKTFKRKVLVSQVDCSVIIPYPEFVQAKVANLNSGGLMIKHGYPKRKITTVFTFP